MALENYPRSRRIVQVVDDLRQKPFEEMRVVDLGCAHGHYTLEMARRGADAVGIEGREEWVRQADRKKAELGIERATFICDDARNLAPETYGTFDVVLCLGLLYHLDAPDVFEHLANIARSCTGFAIIDTQIAMQPISSTQWRGDTYWGWTYEEHPPGRSRAEKEANLGASLDDDFSFWLTRPSLLNALRAVGFTSVYEVANPTDNMYLDGDFKLHADVVTLVAHKGEPVDSFIGSVRDMRGDERWPEDRQPFVLKRPFDAPWAVAPTSAAATVESAFPSEAHLLLFRGYELGKDTAIFEEFAHPPVEPEPGFVKDFIGARVRTSSLWQHVRQHDGQVFPIPIPGDYHCETIEWLGLLRSVVDALPRRRYRIIEFGAGFGMWAVIGGVAARRKGIDDVKIYAVEGDPLLGDLATQHFTDNGFGAEHAALVRGAVGTAAGTAKWPKHDGGAESATYNFRPILEGEADYMSRSSTETIDVAVHALSDLLADEDRWDLAHFDIQGHEADVVASAAAIMNERVRRAVIGTHSRRVEAELLDGLREQGWLLEHEKPCKFTFAPEGVYEGLVTVDGAQIWRNPRLD